MSAGADPDARTHAIATVARRRESPQLTREVSGVEVQVGPGVFGPRGTDTRLIVEHLQELDLSGARFLDLTTGTGVIAKAAALQGASGVAADISEAACENARENLRDYPFEVIRSNAFDSIPAREFDLISVNPPYMRGEVSDELDHAIFGGWELIERVFSAGAAFLKPSGSLLSTWAEWSEPGRYFALAEARGWRGTHLNRGWSPDGERSYRLDVWSPAKG